MMTELSFLIDLLLNEKLSKSAKEKVRERVSEVEKVFASATQFVRAPNPPPPPPSVINGAPQAPSTVAAMQRQALVEGSAGVLSTLPVVVAATPQATQAVQSRDTAINQALSGKPEPGRTSPRKF